jgi:hypothetical protein
MNTTTFPASAAICAALLLMVACGCSQGRAIAGNAAASSARRPPPTVGASTVPSRAALLAFAARIGVTCEIAKDGDELDCIGGRPEVGDYYDVELQPSCDKRARLARVGSQEVELRDRIAPVDRRTVATVKPGELLCVQAIGRAGEHASYYYVRRLDQDSGAEGWVRADSVVDLAQGN